MRAIIITDAMSVRIELFIMDCQSSLKCSCSGQKGFGTRG